MVLKVIPRLQAFSSAICRTFVQYFTAVWRDVTMEGPRDARGINGEGSRRVNSVKVVTTPCRLLCHYLSAAQNFLTTIWPLIEILRSLVIAEK